MQRRNLLLGLLGLSAIPPLALWAREEAPRAVTPGKETAKSMTNIDPIEKTAQEWRAELSEAEFNILREAGTERPGSSELLAEKREGSFVCAGCALPLFKSEWKYESGTGWPSFWSYIEGNVGFKQDRKLFRARTEYHCARCGGHQGHVFDDGPEPTGKRYCNNGLALDFNAA